MKRNYIMIAAGVFLITGILVLFYGYRRKKLSRFQFEEIDKAIIQIEQDLDKEFEIIKEIDKNVEINLEEEFVAKKKKEIEFFQEPVNREEGEIETIDKFIAERDKEDKKK